GRVRGRIGRVLPGGDLAIGVEGGAHVDEHGWPLRLPGELVATHPLEAYGFANGLGEQRRVGGDVVGAVVTVAAGAFPVEETNAVLVHVEDGGERLAEGVDALAAGVDAGAIGPDIGDGAGRPNRGVGLHRE